jgi:DNA modification methylase
MKKMPDNFIDLIVTSPNYNNWRNKRTQAGRSAFWSRTNIVYDTCKDRQQDEDYENEQIIIINEMLRVLKPSGTICYNHKDRIFNFEAVSPLKWIFRTKAKYRQRVTWDRCGMQAYNPVRFFRVEEDIYVLGKEFKGFKWNKNSAKYLSIWRIPPSKNVHGHPATFPEEIVRRCVNAFTEKNDIVYDPFSGSGTTLVVALQMGRQYVGSEISKKYCQIVEDRIKKVKRDVVDITKEPEPFLKGLF